MKTEDFDDAIRKKVNSIYHTYKEDDIDKIHNYVSQKKTAATRLRYAKTAAFSALAVLVAALLTWNIVQLRDRKEMAGKIDTLQNTLAQTQIQNPVVKTDTVYVKEYITKDESVGEKLASEDSDADKNLQENQNTSTDKEIKDQQFANNQLNTNIQAHYKSVEKSRNYNTKHFSGNGNMEKNPLAKNENKHNSNKENKSISENYNNNDRQEPEIPVNKYTMTKTIDLYKTIDPDRDSTYIASEKNASDSANKETEEQKPVVSNNPDNDDTKLSPDVIKPKKNRSLSLSKFHYNVGLGLETANHQKGISIASQVFFTDRFGLNVSLKALDFKNDRFRDQREFHDREGRDLKEVCGPKLQDTGDIENIDRQTMLLQIPVSITYVLPVKNGFGVSFSAGTDIDLSAKQRIGFDRHRTNEPQTDQNLTINTPVSTFNNATFSVGGQKLWRHFMLQTNLFLSPQLKKVEYKKEPVYAGLNIKALYSF